MRNSIQVGDEISTIGGFIGKVVSLKEDTLVIETSADRTKLKLYRWAIRGKEAAPTGQGRRAEGIMSDRPPNSLEIAKFIWAGGNFKMKQKSMPGQSVPALYSVQRC